MGFSKKEKFLMKCKIYQIWRFIVLNLKILKAVHHSKRA